MPRFSALLSLLTVAMAAISGIAVAAAGGLGQSNTANASVISREAGPSATVTASAFPAAASGWALGTEGGGVRIWHTNDAGSAWRVQWRGSGSPLSIVATDRTHAWALIACTVPPGPPGKVPFCGRELLATDDGGARWRVTAKLAASVNRVYFGTRSFGVAVADSCLTDLELRKCPGQLLVTRDGGVRWTAVLSQPAPVFATVSRDKQLWAAEIIPAVTGSHATDLRFLTSTNGGLTWRRLGNVTGLPPLTPEAQLTLATESPVKRGVPPVKKSARLAWAAVFDQLSCAMHGCAAELLTSSNGGRSWTVVNLPDRYPDECGPDGIAFATAPDGTAWAATGRNGAACAPPLGLIYQHGQSGWRQLPPWQQNQIDSLTAVSRAVAYAVSGRGVLLRTEDGGRHWTQVLPGRMRN